MFRYTPFINKPMLPHKINKTPAQYFFEWAFLLFVVIDSQKRTSPPLPLRRGEFTLPKAKSEQPKAGYAQRPLLIILQFVQNMA